MSEELYFNNELRNCLNAAGLSDCGENDAWNYWYQRVHKAHDQAVDRVTEAQRAENAKLRDDRDGWKKVCVNQEVMHVMHEDALDNEIAKLRELVKLLVNCVDRISNEDTFYYQPRRDGCGFDCTANGEGCSFIKLCEQARELGVEVDG